MKVLVVSYSLTGNNRDLAASLAEALEADHVSITETKSRSMGTIVLDIVFRRTPKIVMPEVKAEAHDLVLFVGPVWMGQIATPFRACFRQLGPEIGDYAFVTICGGADGPNPKLADELEKRLGKEPVSLLDLHIADLLPSEPKPTRDDTMAYRTTERDVKRLTDTVAPTLRQIVVG
jgi:flavodoxin